MIGRRDDPTYLERLRHCSFINSQQIWPPYRMQRAQSVRSLTSGLDGGDAESKKADAGVLTYVQWGRYL